MRRVAFVLCVAAAGACSSIPHPSFGPSPSAELGRTLSLTEAMASRGDFNGADSALAALATHFPGTPEALETTYWRALYKLDPSNRATSLASAMASLDGYLTDTRPRAHVTEAITLRRVAAQLDALNKLAANAASQAKDANARAAAAQDSKDAAKPVSDAATTAAADAEIKRLRDELAKANAELDRIRRRLSQPPPRPDR